jgi:hypothetical protein
MNGGSSTGPNKRLVSFNDMRSLLIALAVVVGCGPPGRPAGDGDGGVGDAAQRCMPGEFNCFGNILQNCTDGHFTDQDVCPVLCNPELGCIECYPPAGNTCVEDEVHTCEADGHPGALIETCMGDQQCDAGRCGNLCSDAAALRSYIGCDYWAVDLHNLRQIVGGSAGCSEEVMSLPACVDHMGPVVYTLAGLCDNGDCSASPGYACETLDVCVLDAQGSPFAIVVANPSLTGSAMVTITDPAGVVATISVPPGQIETIFPQSMGMADQSISWSGLESHAYHVVSSRPIVAYQFNPLDNVGVFSNDASLLLPAHTFDTKYYALIWPTATRRPTAEDWNGYVTLVASSAGTTNVSVTTTAGIRAGTGVPSMAAGATQAFAMQQGQTLTLEAVAGGDLSGTLIQSLDNPFGVFVGHVGTLINPDAPDCCADHLEDQLFPTSTWGKAFAISRSLPRGTLPDRLRIMAQNPGTTVTLNPAGGCANPLGPGEFCQVDITGDIEISANEPILVAQYLMSSGGGASGDPAIAFAVPSEQFRTEYDLLVPAEYETSFFGIVTTAAGTVTLDGNDVTAQLNAFGSGGWKGGRVTVVQGRHRIECPGGCGVLVGGYDDDVSYLFAGGLDLEQIVVD